MVSEKQKAISVLLTARLFREMTFTSFSFMVHMSTLVKGNIKIMFSKHFVVSSLVPSDDTFHIPQPPITSDNGLSQRFRFKSVRNRIIAEKKASRNSFRKKQLVLNSVAQVLSAVFQPFPAFAGRWAYRKKNNAKNANSNANPKGS